MNARHIAKLVLTHALPDRVYRAINARLAVREIVSGKRWDSEISILPRFVSPGDTVVDIGANHGLYAYHLSRLVGPSGRVHSFEPLPPNFHILNYTVDSLGLSNVTVHRAACGDKEETAVFCIPLKHGVRQLALAHRGTDGASFGCPVVRLDNAMDTRVAFIKCDVEGAELFVLRGAERILQHHRPVILIEADNHTPRFGYRQEEVFNYAAQHGYRFFDSSMRARAAFTETGNYFFVPTELAP
jgi:FkbM family methyltransferase